MNKITILTPDNIEVDYTLASLTLRAAAAGIDMLLQIIVFSIFCLIGFFIMDFETIFVSGLSRSDYIIIAILLVSYGLIMYGYYVITDIVMKGQTIGKKVYNIRIIRENGEGITALHAFIREFLRITIDGYGLGIILVFLNKKYKRLGDMLASTIVVCEEPVKDDFKRLLTSENNYKLEIDDLQLLKDYVARKSVLKDLEARLFEEKYFRYLDNKYGIKMDVYDKEKFIQEITK